MTSESTSFKPIIYTESTKKLIPFFRKLADDIENLELTPSEMMISGQMYMLWEYENFAKTSISDNELNKYLFTGWFIYNNINGIADDNNITPPNSPSNSHTNSPTNSPTLDNNIAPPNSPISSPTNRERYLPGL